jgi:uncharacterized protein
MLTVFYNNIIFKYSRLTLLSIFILTLTMLFLALELKIDASSDTLILEKDKDLRYFQTLNKRYNSPDFLIIAYQPKEKLLSKSVKINIKNISNELEKLEKVNSVISILNVPLLESSNKTLADLLTGIPTLEDGIVDDESIRKELTTSYIYKNNLVSEDFNTTAILINLNQNKTLDNLREKKQQYLELIENKKLDELELTDYKATLLSLSQEREKERNKQKQLVFQVREIINNYKVTGDIYLGGIPMIANDVVAFVKNDLKVFGISILLFLIVTLTIIFRQSRWIIMPIITCFFSVIITAGIFSIFNWEVTVISSNFISLQLILTMAITIHLIVRYRELALKNIYTDQKSLLFDTIRQMIKPCFFTVITTIAGFSSLILSGLLPVINFGWMMSVGVIVSLILTFIMFPALMKEFKILLPNTKFENFFNLPQLVAEITLKYKKLILILAIVLMTFSVIGISKLKVENSFINYFKSNTEIYKGMKVIDENLGGTTLLDVTIDFKNNKGFEVTDSDVLEEDDDFDEVFSDIISDSNDPKYWFTKDKMNKIEKTHDYLDSLKETGKVLSFATILKIGRSLNNGQDLDSVQLALLYEKLPQEYKDVILRPYISTENNQARITLRVKDSEPSLRRNDLIKKIKKELPETVGLDNNQVKLSNILILYNNMLQSLFSSQIMTLGLVIMALLAMFLILFRSIKISLIALIPNLLSIGAVLGLMGILDIPLDMMTITIAAISMGIAVDNTIHYIFRHKKEYLSSYNYNMAMKKTHSSIGYALYYTTLTIIVGFSILVFSNFIPSIYFGLLTSLAMIVALLASLTLVPSLLAILKPYPKKN